MAMGNLKIITINLRGLRNTLKRKKLFTWLSDNDIDIAFLQETYCGREFMPYFDAGYTGTVYHSLTDSSHSRGTAIMISKKISYKMLSDYQDYEDRKTLTNIEIDDIAFAILGDAPKLDKE